MNKLVKTFQSMPKALCIIFFIINFSFAKSQNASERDSLNNLINDLNEKIERNENKVITVGISLGYRELYKKYHEDKVSYSISPFDSTLKIDKVPYNDFVISTSLIITPLVRNDYLTEKIQNSQRLISRSFYYVLKNSGFGVNINLAEINNSKSNISFNKSIEGGFGYSLRISQNVFIQLNREIVFVKGLRSFYKENQKILDKTGNVITSISSIENNDEYFVTKNLIGYKYSIVITF